MIGGGWACLLILPAALMLAAVLACLHERRLVGLPRETIGRWRRTSIFGKFIICAFVLRFAYTGATKLMQPMGYINTVNLVGIGPCNNPVYLGVTTTNHVAVCGSDDVSRSRFTRHRYVFAEGVIFDACIGPVLGTQTRLEYLRSVIDSSTEAERISSPYSPFGPPSTTDFETRNYSIIGVK